MTAGALPPLVVTGASGFVGRRLVAALRERAARSATPRDVTLLVRDPAVLASFGTLPPHWRAVRADLAAASLAADAIPRDSVVLHLAAATGRLNPAVMRAVNVDGTGRLTRAARDAGAAHFIFVSSIAASFRNRRWYHYAEAKLAAERLVADAGLPFTIVRPTMVFGAGSPVQEGLERIAAGGLPVVPGSGNVRVQPIHVDDLVAALLALADAPPPTGATIEVGGGERCTLRDLLAHMRAARRLTPRSPWSVPLAPVRGMLGAAETIIGTRLPVTAGQLASFVNDSVAAPNALVDRLLPHPRPLAAILARPDAPTSGFVAAQATDSADQALAAEFGIFARYLGRAAPAARATTAYVASHPSVGASPDTLDLWLVAVASRSTFGCALADSYARLARPQGTLRRKLVLTLAVLESSPVVHAAYDTARPSSAASAWVALAALGGGWALRTACAVTVFAPLHLAASVAGRERQRG